MNISEQKAQAARLLENNSAFSLATRLLQAEREKCMVEQEYKRVYDKFQESMSLIYELKNELEYVQMEEDCGQPSGDLSVNYVMIPVTAWEFLLGSGSIDGCGFGDPHPTITGRFWWRSRIGEMVILPKESMI